jgi:RNAse (barnase) inhibitor barstar
MIDEKTIDFLASFNIPIELELGYDDEVDKWCIRIYTLCDTPLNHEIIDTGKNVQVGDDFDELKNLINRTMEELKDKVKIKSNF